MELSIGKYSYPNRGIASYSFIVKVVLLLTMGMAVSSFFFPFEFTFLPSGLNTKIMLAVVGIGVLGLNLLYATRVEIDKHLLYASIIAVLFSAIGYVSADQNNSQDLSYANYVISFATWLLSAYAVCTLVRQVHGYFNFELLVNYLIGVCVVQCILALVIDYNPSVKLWVDTYISQDPVASVEFLNKVERLYGIGAAVDVAGTRFSIVLIGLATVLNNLKDEQGKIVQIVLYWLCFMVIAVVGNMISRTTIVGVAMALFYLAITAQFFKRQFNVFHVKYGVAIVLITLILILVIVYLYNTDEEVYRQLRFAFEGFFNWVEKGEWTTSSTERLNSVMWIWPDVYDIKTWVIGKATFDDWHAVGTDIGYCRFVFYNGLLGLITFSLFFVYNAWAMALKFPQFKLFFVFLLALTFVIWLKVATDLFLIYALLYNLDDSSESEKLYDMYFKKLAL